MLPRLSDGPCVAVQSPDSLFANGQHPLPAPFAQQPRYPLVQVNMTWGLVCEMPSKVCALAQSGASVDEQSDDPDDRGLPPVLGILAFITGCQERLQLFFTEHIGLLQGRPRWLHPRHGRFFDLTLFGEPLEEGLEAPQIGFSRWPPSSGPTSRV